MPKRQLLLSILLTALVALSACSELSGPSPTPAPVIIIATPTPGSSQPAPTEPALNQAPPTAGPTQTPFVVVATPTPGGEPSDQPGAPASDILAKVKERGRLICGVNADLPGFGYYDNVRQTWSGFDIDFCKALAAAIFGDANAVEYVALGTAPGPNERFTAIREGRVDVLIRNTTWTITRDLSGIDFGPTTFHDGQTFMVRKNSGITTLASLENKRICVAKGTTSELNLSDEFNASGISYTAVVLDGEENLYPAYDDGDCDAVTSDSSQLASKRQTLKNPNDHEVLGLRFSREPLGPAFAENDSRWRDVVSWVVFATMYAEELRVDQRTVQRLYTTTTDPRIRRLLGLEGEIGAELGLPADFGYQVILQVGNYGDIYDRNLGPKTPFALDRGPNKAWNLGAGGVLASPPFR